MRSRNLGARQSYEAANDYHNAFTELLKKRLGGIEVQSTFRLAVAFRTIELTGHTWQREGYWFVDKSQVTTSVTDPHDQTTLHSVWY